MFVFCDMQDVVVEGVLEALNENADAGGYIIEGFPRDQGQLEAFNKKVRHA